MEDGDCAGADSAVLAWRKAPNERDPSKKPSSVGAVGRGRAAGVREVKAENR